MSHAKKDSYHHGNLREALVETAMAALGGDSLENLSLRGLAKTLGVSPTAVYGHFSDKTALLVALKTQGFQQLGSAMQVALDALPPESAPEDKVRALGHAYMAFARRNPNLFDLLFAWVPESYERITQDCLDAGTRSEGLLRATLIEMLRGQGQEPSEYQASVASFSAWALVHGISILLRTGAVEGAIRCDNWPEAFSCHQPESQARVIDQLLTIQIAGLKAACGLGEKVD